LMEMELMVDKIENVVPKNVNLNPKKLKDTSLTQSMRRSFKITLRTPLREKSLIDRGKSNK